MTARGEAGGQRALPPPAESFPGRLERALAARSMTLSGLQRRLAARGHRVALSSLSAWRSGLRRPEAAASLDAVSEIEAILGLASGHLLQARGPARRPGPRPPEAPLVDLVPATVPVEEALRRLGLADWEQWLVEEEVHVSVDIDESGSMTHAVVRTLLRGLRAGACLYPVYAFADQPLPEPVGLAVLAGARVTGEEVDLTVGLTAWRLALPRPLEVGETAWLEHRLDFVDLGEPDTHVVQHVTRRVTEVTVWVRFHPDHHPAACHLLVEGSESVASRVPVDVALTGAAHVTVRGFGPGRAGVLFDW